MLTLVLMIVLSSFCISNASTVSYFYILDPTENQIDISLIFGPHNGYTVYKSNNQTHNSYGQFQFIGPFYSDHYKLQWDISSDIVPSTNYASVITSNDYPLCISTIGNVPYNNQTNVPVYDEFGNVNGPDYNNPIKTVSIKPSQRILFNYASADKDNFLKSLSCTPDKSITVHQAYYSGGQVTDLVIKKDTTGNFIGGSPVTLASFPSHRTLNTNEYLGYSQANGGNWVWTDFIPGSSGGPVGTDSNSLVTFTIDTRYCSYRVVSANTGLEITSGGIADVPQVPDDGIYNNNQNPWGPGDITDDYLLDRADYEDGIIGDIQYGFDTLFKFLKMPFELLYKFIMTLGEIIQYALGTVSGFTTALQGIYAILPGPIWFLVIMAISINVFKLIFGR